MMKRFYVGAKHIGAAIGRGVDTSCQRDTLEEAIREAETMIRNREAESLVIVKIIAIVKIEQPIKIEFVD